MARKQILWVGNNHVRSWTCNTTFKKNRLEIQYENRRPVLLCDGSVLTRIDPSRAGTNNKTEA